MNISISNSSKELGKAAGKKAAMIIKEKIQANGIVNIILATGTSQFETINELISDTEIDWRKVVVFHLDEYIGLPITHPASFRKYLTERFISKVSVKKVFLINGENDPEKECDRLGEIISQHPIDVALVGIGENGHLAFNDPPADFETEQPYIVVDLDEACRNQQMGEGWFKRMEEVPRKAISMSIKQIMKSTHIVCSVPDQRKALAVKNSIEHSPSPMFPATILQQHLSCFCFLDLSSASMLSSKNSSTT